jgi:hypothetical protein
MLPRMPDVFDPEVACWSLAQALRRTADQGMLAALHRDIIDAAAAEVQHDPIEWWHWADPAPPPPAPAADPPRVLEMEDGRRRLLMADVIETQFRHKLETGKLQVWGRPGTMLADHLPVPPHVGIRIDWSDGTTLRLRTGELLCDVRVEKVVAGTPTAITPLTLENLVRWLREYYRNGGRAGERAEIDAATKYFDLQVRRGLLRQARDAVLKELKPELFDDQGKLKPGRRPV